MPSLNKKGDVNQTFMFLTAAIITGVILIFGGMSFVRLMDNTERIQATQFRADFEDAIGSICSKYGSVGYVDLDGLEKYDQMCVFSLRNTALITPNNCPIIDKYPLIKGDLDDAPANVFLIDEEGVSARFVNNDIDLGGEHCACQKVSVGSVRMRLEGLGKKALLEFVND